MRSIFGSNPVLISCLLLVHQSSCFILPTQQQHQQQLTILAAKKSDSSFNDEMENLETARQHFENLMDAHFSWEDASREQNNNNIPRWPHSTDEYTPTPLTESSRRRRVLEMELLNALKDSDEAIEELMSLWIVERGTEAADKLKAMESICSPGLVREEGILRSLLNEYGVHWAEPVSRLSALLYFQGRSDESEHWCDVALAVKPWHFEAVHTQVLNALREKDIARAIRCQRKGLPPLNPRTNNRARKAWVKRAVQEAQESLNKADTVAEVGRRSGGGESPFQADEVWQ